MASLRRARPLLSLGLLLLAACGSAPGPDDPALAAATGIPVGAPNAAGVSFDGVGAAATAAPSDPDEADLSPHPLPLPKALPPDPFDPMGGNKLDDAGPPPPRPKPPKKKGMQL